MDSLPRKLLSPVTFGVVILAGSCCVALPLRAQQGGTVEGRVTAAERGAPLPDVVVRGDSGSRRTTTDARGRYRLSLPIGRHFLVAQQLGRRAIRRQVDVAAGAIARVDFSLTAAAVLIAPVVVSATRELQRRADASATIDVVDGAEVRLARAAHPAGILNRIPGVHVSDLSGEGHSMAMRQPITTKPMYLYLEDGVPTRATGFFNHNALYEVNIPQSGGVEVLKGPGTALYGSDAIGGVVNVLTRPAPATPSAEAAVEGGGHGYRRVLITGGTTRGKNGVRADLNLTHGASWKDRAPFSRQSATLRWDALAPGGWAVKSLVTGSNISQQDVPSLTATQFAGYRALNRAPIAYRRVQAVRVSSALERERGAGLWSFTPYARYNVLELLPSWQLTYDPQTWDTRNTSLGMLAKYRRDFVPLRTRVIVGADADVSPGRFVARAAATTPTGPDRTWESYTAGPVQYDYDVTYRALSPYVHAELSPVRRLRVDLGARYDASGYAYRNGLAPLATGAHRRPPSTRVSYRHLSPKVGATLDVLPGVSVYGSYRHGFRAPSQGQLFQQNSAENTVGLAPVTVGSYEGGVRGQIGDRVLFQVASYDMTIRDDILTFVAADNRRVATNAGATRHRGVEVGVGAALTPTLKLDASYAIASHRYVDWAPQAARPAAGARPTTPAVSFSGNRVEQAPRDISNVLLTYGPRLLQGGRVAAEWSTTGRYAMDPGNERFYPGYEVVNLHANYFLRPSAELFARVTNLGDRAYAELASYDAFQQEQFTPGSPRSAFVGLRYAWQR